MANIAFGLLKVRRDRRYLRLRSFVLVFLVGFLGRSAAATGTDVHDARLASVGPGASFAIADFDGDQHPDLASVQGGRVGSSSTDYWIQLQLSASGRQAIQLVAPSGGLLIEARDVNGDHAIDLVLATAWFKQPVAILLNDGHGRFSRVEPTAFPGAFTDATTNWASSSDQTTEAACVPRSRALRFSPMQQTCQMSGGPLVRF